MKPVMRVEELEWQSHPTAKGVEIKVLVSRATHGAGATCMLVRIERGWRYPSTSTMAMMTFSIPWPVGPECGLRALGILRLNRA